MIGVAGPLADLPDHLRPVHVRQAQVEQDQIGVSRLRLRQTVPSGGRFEQPITVRRQRGAQEPANLRLVLDHEQRRLMPGHGVLCLPLTIGLPCLSHAD